MKTIIAGSRNCYDYAALQAAITAFEFMHKITEVVSGCASGVDQMGEKWAKEHSIPVVQFRADWNRLGKAAGFVRNQQMADYADALIAVWDGVSRGTKNMIDEANERNLVVYVYRLPDNHIKPLEADVSKEPPTDQLNLFPNP